MEYGCIAERLGHSFSKEIHARLADYSYELCELRPEQVGPFLQARDFRGINVTIPYKSTVIPYLDELSDTARMIGAVNTIVNRDGRLWGDNTDFYGMKYLLTDQKINVKNKKVLVFGTGGTAKTAVAVVRHLGADEIVVVSRGEKAGAIPFASALELHRDAQIIINTTPAGMVPKEDARPYGVELDRFTRLEGLLDAIYHPLRSELVLSARERGVNAVGGLTMLVVQAAVAAERFLGEPVAPEIVAAVNREIRMSKENMVLIGMPGSGKSAVGACLAQHYGRELIDTDELVTQMTGKTPAELLLEQGEAQFRALEAEAVRRAAAHSGMVIATGGGAVLREDNVRALRRNGRLLFLDRPPDQLPVGDDRPLSRDRALLAARYAERYDRYCAVADARVAVSGDVEQTARVTAQAFEALI
jgi:shikimate dehydrogenase